MWSGSILTVMWSIILCNTRFYYRRSLCQLLISAWDHSCSAFYFDSVIPSPSMLHWISDCLNILGFQFSVGTYLSSVLRSMHNQVTCIEARYALVSQPPPILPSRLEYSAEDDVIAMPAYHKPSLQLADKAEREATSPSEIWMPPPPPLPFHLKIIYDQQCR